MRGYTSDGHGQGFCGHGHIGHLPAICKFTGTGRVFHQIPYGMPYILLITAGMDHQDDIKIPYIEFKQHGLSPMDCL